MPVGQASPCLHPLQNQSPAFLNPANEVVNRIDLGQHLPWLGEQKTNAGHILPPTRPIFGLCLFLCQLKSYQNLLGALDPHHQQCGKVTRFLPSHLDQLHGIPKVFFC